MTPYEEAIDLNARVVPLVEEYYDNPGKDQLLEIFQLLHPVSIFEVRRVISNAGLDPSLEDDMLQDAFLRLEDVVFRYTIFKSPVFTSFWRTCLRNHLITSYKKMTRFSELDERNHPRSQNHDAKLLLQEIESFLSEKFSQFQERDWRIAWWVARTRILCLPDDRIPQSELSKILNVSQAHVHNWQGWIQREIFEKFGNTPM